MKTRSVDKFLLGIVVGVLLLVAAAVALVVLRPPPTYADESTAAGVAQNYLMALQQEDYGRAYAYLSPTLPGYPPSAEQFARDVFRTGYRESGQGACDMEVVSTRPLPVMLGEAEQVTVRERCFGRSGLFPVDRMTVPFDMRLQRENGVWKILDSDRYFIRCWKERLGCQ